MSNITQAIAVDRPDPTDGREHGECRRRPNDRNTSGLRPLFAALIDALLLIPSEPLFIAASMVQTNPARAKLLRDHLAAKGENYSRFALKRLNDFRPMVARTEAHRLLDVIDSKTLGPWVDRKLPE